MLLRGSHSHPGELRSKMVDAQAGRKVFLCVGAVMAILAFILQLVAFFTPNWLVMKNIEFGLLKRYEGANLEKDYQNDVTFDRLLIVIILLAMSIVIMLVACLLGIVAAVKKVFKVIIAAVVLAGLGFVCGAVGTGLMFSNTMHIQEGIAHYFNNISGDFLTPFGYSTWISFGADVCALLAFVFYLLSLCCRPKPKDDSIKNKTPPPFMYPREPQPQVPDFSYPKDPLDVPYGYYAPPTFEPYGYPYTQMAPPVPTKTPGAALFSPYGQAPLKRPPTAVPVATPARAPRPLFMDEFEDEMAVDFAPED